MSSNIIILELLFLTFSRLITRPGWLMCVVTGGSWDWKFWMVCCKLWLRVAGDPDLLDPGLVAADLTDLALVTLLQLDIRSELAVNTSHVGC